MFDIIRLPDDVEQGAQGGPAFQTSIVVLSSGNEQRNEDWSAPRQGWDVGYGVQGRTDYEFVRDFFMARRGRAHAFLFKDWSDFKVTNQLLGIGNGTTRTFLLNKTYEAGGPNPFSRRITRPINASIVVRVDGTLSTHWSAGAGGWIRFDPGFAPANAKEVRADFEYDVPVRFAVDMFPLKLDWSEAGTVPSIPVVETRDDFNAAPGTITLLNTVTSVPETSTSPGVVTPGLPTHVRVADISVDDDPFGTDVLTLTGADAALFELVGTLTPDRDGVSLYIRAGVKLDYETKNALHVTVNVDDATVAGTHPASSVNFTVNLTDVNEPPAVHLINMTVVKPLTAATGVLTFGANPSVDQTVTINGHVYTFKASPSTTANEVQIGATASISLDNLIAAINHAGGSGTLYGSATVANTDVTAAAGAGDTMNVTAIVLGQGGNSLATTTTVTSASWANATLTGAVTSTAAPIHAGDIVVVDDLLGLRAVTLSGADAASFELTGSLSASTVDPVTGLTNYTGMSLQTVAGLDYTSQKVFHVTVNVADSGLASPPQGSALFTFSFGVTPGSSTVSVSGNVTVPNYTSLTVKLSGPGAGGCGFNTAGHDGTADTTITALGLSAGRGKVATSVGSSTDGGLGGAGGIAAGGDLNQNGLPGNSGVIYSKNIDYLVENPALPLGGVPGLQFYTAAGGGNGEGTGAGPSQAGAFLVLNWPTFPTTLNVNGANATSLGGGGAGSIQYGWGNFVTHLDFFNSLPAFAYGRPSGGGGAVVTKTYVYGVTPGFPQPGDVLAVVVGLKGIGGVSFASGGDGFDGRAEFTWS